MTYSTKLKTKNKKQVTTLLTGCQAAIYKDLNQIGSKTQRSELWVLENWSSMIQHQPSTTTVKVVQSMKMQVESFLTNLSKI